MVNRRTEQYKHEPCWHRHLGYVTKQRRLLKANERIQRSREAVHVTNQYVGSLGAGRNLLQKVLVILQSIDQSINQSINQSFNQLARGLAHVRRKE